MQRPTITSQRVVAFVVLAAIFILVVWGPTDAVIGRAEAYVDGAGALGPVLLWIFFVLAALLCMPGSALTIFAGATMGFVWGTVLASTATVFSAAVSYLLMRTALAPRLEKWLKTRPRRRALFMAIKDGDWRLVGISRLSPMLPLGPSNYIFGLADLRFVPYLIVTWLATLPSKMMWAQLGAAGKQGLALFNDPKSADASEVAYLILGLVATVGAAVFAGVLATRRLKAVLEDQEPSKSSASS